MENKDTPKKRVGAAIRKAEFLKAFRKSHGIKAAGMKAAGIGSYTTIRKWEEEDAEFAEAVKDYELEGGDFVESALFNKIEEGDTAAIIFYCKTKLKNRGYTERREITAADGKDLIKNTDVDLSKLTPQQRSVLLSIGMDIINKKEE